MFKYFRIKKAYTIRHAILEYLYNKLDQTTLHKTELTKSITSVEEISTYLNITPIEFKKYHMSFHSFAKDLDHVQCFATHNKYTIGITEAGIIAYLDDYWIKEGQKELNDKVYNVTKWALPIVTFLISLAALILSIAKR